MDKKAKEIVKLRFRKLKNGEQSAYFDIYANGVRKYLWQEERIIPEHEESDKEHNQRVMATLGERRRSLIAELTIDKSGIANRSFNTELTLLQWIDIYEKELSTRAKHSYMRGFSRLKSLLTAFNADIKLKDVDEHFIESFYEFLKTNPCTGKEEKTFTEGTIWYYLKMLGNCMNGAIRERHIDANPCRSTLSVCRKRQKKRGLTCLSQKELVRLIDTPCHQAYVKRIFLFACFTGATPETLRNLQWKHIYKKDGRTWAIFKKVRSVHGKDITVPLTDMAVTCLPPRCRAKGSSPVFEMRGTMVMMYHLRKWRKKAKITTQLNYIVAKNTYASLLLCAKADYYTAGYMMGFQSTRYMEEYEGYRNIQRHDSVGKLDKVIDEEVIKSLCQIE